MVNVFSDVIQENKNSVICYLAVNYHCQQALLVVLHNHDVPTDPYELYKFLYAKKSNIMQLKKKNVLKDDQINLLLPQNQRTFSKKWDITLICVVIINFSTLPPPNAGWKQYPDPSDITTAAIVVRIRKARNDMNHSTLEALKDEKKFNEKFTAVEDVLVTLNYTKIAEFRNMKSKSFNPVLFMDGIQCPIENKNIYIKCLKWYKEENEKSKFIFLLLTVF